LCEPISNFTLVDHDLGERKLFTENPQLYLDFRKKQEAYCNNVQRIFFKDSEAQKQFTLFLDANLKETTKPKPWLYDVLRPNYAPGCRRLIMGQAWLECMQEDNANLIPKNVKEFTENGIIDEDGVERNYDAIICATGFDTSVLSLVLPSLYVLMLPQPLGQQRHTFHWKKRNSSFRSMGPRSSGLLWGQSRTDAEPFPDVRSQYSPVRWLDSSHFRVHGSLYNQMRPETATRVPQVDCVQVSVLGYPALPTMACSSMS
jgi:cation diffusion facilitator CzcD-associated flavoprotein CzcO